MTKVLVTGACGFIGRNLVSHLSRVEGLQVFSYDILNDQCELAEWLGQADIVFHLAGVNRPQEIEEFQQGNAGFTEEICRVLRQKGVRSKIVMASSIQAELENPYGISKRQAEESLMRFSGETGSAVAIYRLKNVFGKWCRPEYNSVTATFCHKIAHDQPITISDPDKEIELVYIDDIVLRFLEEMNNPCGPESYIVNDDIPYKRITLGDLAGRIQAYHDCRSSLMVPDFSERFSQCLYATYLSYVEPHSNEYALDVKSDIRGSLAEFVKSPYFGQIFVSRTHPGITRGNHYHHTKTEKFFVVAGEGLIRMRHIEGGDVLEYLVCGADYRVVDIPPGYTHSITNVGQSEMIALFWASEVFDPDHPDTFFMEV